MNTNTSTGKNQTRMTVDNTTLAQLRKTTVGVKQSVVALEMNVQEPAVSKLEQKLIGNTSVEKLRKYVEAIGGTLGLSITLPDGTVVSLN